MKRIVIVLLAGLIVCGCGLRSEDPNDQKAAKPGMPSLSTSEEGQQPFVTAAIDLLKKGEIVPAVKMLDEAIKNDPKDIQAYMLLGQTYMHTNEVDRAADTFAAALNVDPENGEAYYMLAVSNGLRGQKDVAIVNAEKALKIFEQERDEEKFKATLVLLHGLSQE